MAERVRDSLCTRVEPRLPGSNPGLPFIDIEHSARLRCALTSKRSPGPRMATRAFVRQEIPMAYLAFMLALHITTGASPALAHHTWVAAYENGVDPFVLGSVLATEHPGKRYSGKCSSAGACGNYQLMPFWARRTGYHADERHDAALNADMAAKVIVLNHESHAKRRCRDAEHDWRAHWKSGRKKRDTKRTRWKVRWWKKEEARLRRTYWLVRSAFGLLF